MLKELKSLVTELNYTNSSNNKKEILKSYPNLTSIIEYIYNPFKMFGITSDVIKKFDKPITYISFQEKEIFILLDNLISRKVTGHDAIRYVKSYINSFPEYTDLIYDIIDKDLKCRLGVTEINKVFQNLIPTFEVTLADKFTEKSKIDLNWVVERKLDGLRCISIYKDGDIKFYSRNGKEFETLGILKQSLLSEIPKDYKPFVIDGEICIVNENGDEDFTEIIKEYNKKDHTIKNPMYIMFDMMSYDEFIKGETSESYKRRHHNLKHSIIKNAKNTKVLEYVNYSPETFNEMLTKSREYGWEGLMLRNDVPYEAKRTKNLLKVKDFQDEEFKVIDVVTGPIRIIDELTGLEKTENLLSNIVIDYKGFKVSVGSGFTQKERIYFKNNPNDILGKVVTIKYFQESKDKDGSLSLRFPIFKNIHGLKREF